MTAETDLYSTLALYGVTRSHRMVRRFFDATSAWFAGIGLAPDSGSLHTKRRRVPPTSFMAIQRRLGKKDDAENVVAVGLGRLLPNARIPVADYRCSAYLDTEDSYAFVAVHGHDAPLSSQLFLNFAVELTRLLSPTYGIGYSMSLKCGPGMYAIGLEQGVGLFDEAQGMAIERWGDAMDEGAYDDGYLRDIYPMNVISKAAWSRRIGRVQLKSWIAAEHWRGTLTKIDATTLLWLVDERNIARVRHGVVESGLLLCAT